MSATSPHGVSGKANPVEASDKSVGELAFGVAADPAIERVRARHQAEQPACSSTTG